MKKTFEDKLIATMMLILEKIAPVISVILVVIAIVLVVKITPIFHQFNTDKYEIQSYTVSYGDTIWDIGMQNKLSSEDNRQWIFEVEKLNNLDLTKLSIGQQIMIYTAKGDK